MNVRKLPLKDHLFARSLIDPDGCWEWLGFRNPTKHSYGLIRVDGRMERVHRVAYRLFVGPIPEGKHILHHCDNPPCWRPEHLYAGVPLDNAHDRERRGRSKVKIQTADLVTLRHDLADWVSAQAIHYQVTTGTIRRAIGLHDSEHYATPR